VRKKHLIKSILKWLLCFILLLSLVSCDRSELPSDAGDPSEALIGYVREFWDSDIYDNAIFEAFWNSKTASEDLLSFHRLNAMKAKLKILTKSNFKAETVSIDGTKAVVKLSIHGMNFGEYAETYLYEFDKLQGSVIIVEGVMIGLTAEEVTFALQMMPISAVDDERVTFRDFEQEFELRYKNGNWVIHKPAHKKGQVFLELFGEHITEVQRGRYKFRQGA